LKGVGDPALGEWEQIGEIAVHLRRRLTAKEMAYAGITEVRDIRGTTEQAERIDRLRPFLPDGVRQLVATAFP